MSHYIKKKVNIFAEEIKDLSFSQDNAEGKSSVRFAKTASSQYI